VLVERASEAVALYDLVRKLLPGACRAGEREQPGVHDRDVRVVGLHASGSLPRDREVDRALERGAPRAERVAVSRHRERERGADELPPVRIELDELTPR
jgi:hypothetical protein